MPADALPVPLGGPTPQQHAPRSLRASASPDTCTVTFGPYTDAAGTVLFAGLTGTITPSARVVNTLTGAVMAPTPIPVTLDGTGQATVALPYTDLLSNTPAGFTYTVHWKAARFDPSPGDLTFALPQSSGPTVDFDLLVPAAPNLAIPGGVTRANLDGLVAALLADPTSAAYAAAQDLPNYPHA